MLRGTSKDSAQYPELPKKEFLALLLADDVIVDIVTNNTNVVLSGNRRVVEEEERLCLHVPDELPYFVIRNKGRDIADLPFSFKYRVPLTLRSEVQNFKVRVKMSLRVNNPYLSITDRCYREGVLEEQIKSTGKAILQAFSFGVGREYLAIMFSGSEERGLGFATMQDIFCHHIMQHDA